MFWTSIGFLSLVVIAIVLSPLLRRGVRATSQVTHSVRVYQDQLAELDRELASGLLTEEQAGAARLEIERRILAVKKTAEAPATGLGRLGRGLTVAVIALALPAGALFVYLTLGMPTLADQPLASRTQELKFAKQMRQVEEFLTILAARVEKRPEDAIAWDKLGRLYSLLGKFPESTKAYGRVHALKPQEADAAANHGEAMVFESEGTVTKPAEKIFAEILATNPKHVKARFYLGSALAQRPKGLARAIEVWSGLEADSPPDAPWLKVLRQNLRLAETELASLTQTDPKTAPAAGTPPVAGTPPAAGPPATSPDAGAKQ